MTLIMSTRQYIGKYIRFKTKKVFQWLVVYGEFAQDRRVSTRH
jgi:hypothetical protein